MSFEDARKILSGGDTAATEYFRGKTTDKLTTAFRPTVEQATNEVGVTRQYKDLVGRYQASLRQERVAGRGWVRRRKGAGRTLPCGGGGREEDPHQSDGARHDLLKEVFGKVTGGCRARSGRFRQRRQHA